MSDAIEHFTHTVTATLSRSEAAAQSDPPHASPKMRQAEDQGDEALNSFKSEVVTEEQQDAQKTLSDMEFKIELQAATIEHQADIIARLQQINALWKKHYAHVDGSRQPLKQELIHAEQERLLLLARLEGPTTQQDSQGSEHNDNVQHIPTGDVGRRTPPNSDPESSKAVKKTTRFAERHSEEKGGETSGDNLRECSKHSAHHLRPRKQQQAKGAPLSVPVRRNAGKRKALDTMDVDDPLVRGRRAGKATKMR